MTPIKNILILSPFFFPEPISTGKFNTELAIELSNQGHKVKVLCFHPLYPDWKIKISEETLKNIEIIRGGSNLFFTKFSFLRRVILEISYSFFVLFNIKKLQKNIDIIIPVFPPSLAFYSILYFLNPRIKKIGIVHDLQVVYSLNKKGLMNKFITYFIYRIEKTCYRNCDKLIFLSNEMKEKSRKIYNLKNVKLDVQYPFVSIDRKITNALNHIFDPQKNHIVYSGALGEKQNPSKLYKFFDEASLKIENSIFHFFSKGDEISKLRKHNDNPKIKFHDLVNKENLGELYEKSTVQIIPQKQGTSVGSLPSKLPNLLFSNCKILLITDSKSELNYFFKNNNLSQVETSWDNSNLIKSLNNLIQKDVDFESQRNLAEKYFSVDQLTKKILS